MESSVNKKITISELAKLVKVSKPTIYSRAKLLGIKLNGVYSDEEVEALRQPRKKVNSKGNNRKVKPYLDSNFTLKKENSELEAELRREINYLKKQLNVKDKQITEVNKLADQSQKLQADLQRKLDSQNQELLTLKVRDKTGLWARLFGKKK